MNQRWTQLDLLLQEFQAFLALQVPKLGIQEGPAGDLSDRSPALDRPGVYLLFDATSVLKYIGSAAAQPMINRVRTYLGPGSRLPFVPKYIDLIPFDWQWCFFAPALELYLIQRIENHRLLTNGDKLLNTLGMFAGVREWFDLTHGAVRNRDNAEAEPSTAANGGSS